MRHFIWGTIRWRGLENDALLCDLYKCARQARVVYIQGALEPQLTVTVVCICMGVCLYTLEI